MQVSEAKQQLETIVNTLSEQNVLSIIDFANFLKSKNENIDFLSMQRSSESYKEWTNPVNDIYDEVFKHEVPTR